MIVWAIGALGLLIAARGGRAGRVRQGYSYGGPPRKAGVNRDPEKLLPEFADKLEVLFRRMRARGFQPYLWEGYRSPARARTLAKKGTGIQQSMHTLGAAADIVNGAQLGMGGNPWVAPRQFWQALGQEARKLGLTWGGRWENADRPHVQTITVSEQTAFRQMSDAQRAQYV